MLIIDGIEIRPVGVGEPACPSCGTMLAKFPMRKTSCPHCGAPIHSRKQPFDGNYIDDSRN
jgi:predicted amidophosphoribosyltransferase